MTTKLDAALALAAKGFWVFPIEPNGKRPALKSWQQFATRDPEKIAMMWRSPMAHTPDSNIGIYTGKFGDDGALVVIDVDTKKGKDGYASLVALELEGLELPPTLEADTPSGGRHLFFRVDAPVRQGTDILGEGLDIRSRGGYVLGAGSTIGGRAYGWRRDCDVASAPDWLRTRLRDQHRERDQSTIDAPISIDSARALSRAISFLCNEAPLAIEGHGGDETTYKVAARLKDFGVGEAREAFQLMAEHWNERCSPPWEPDDLLEKVRNAYQYGTLPVGTAAPEVDFAPIETAAELSPHEKLNREFAFVIAGGGSHILWETTDPAGRFKLEHLAMTAFHQKFASKKIPSGQRSVPLTQDWMEWSKRRSYDGLVFLPERDAPARFYNLWRGFAVQPWPKDQPVTKEAQDALDKFLEHAKANVCRGDEALFRWLIGYFAHLVQRPWEKPLVAIVFRGGKGVGKNALVERVGALLGWHFLVTSNKRYLLGNFNGYLEHCLLLCFDEAFWSGDKSAEGTLKDMITGAQHVIEHKGKEPYAVDNRTRVCIIGNENWIVPASHDERRFAVFDVGDGRKQDRYFFQAMREGMERGGYGLLLRFLSEYDLSEIDINEAPRTKALLEQKIATLDTELQWWHACLVEGRIVGGDFGGEWPDKVETDRFRNAFARYARERNVRGRLSHDGQLRKALVDAVDLNRGRVRIEGVPTWVYRLPELDAARAAWDDFMGQKGEWTA